MKQTVREINISTKMLIFVCLVAIIFLIDDRIAGLGPVCVVLDF
jgi:hypothetical protein